jgi:predicted outer membrane repeat protein
LQVWIVGGPGATIRPTIDEQPTIITLERGAPRVHISALRLLGQLVVNEGELLLSDCILEQHDRGKRLGSAQISRAVSILGGHAALSRTVLRGHVAGAVAVHAATLIIFDCAIRDCHAPSGGAMLVSGRSNVTIVHTHFINNSADVSGGALQVELLTPINAPDRGRTCGLIPPVMHYTRT